MPIFEVRIPYTGTTPVSGTYKLTIGAENSEEAEAIVKAMTDSEIFTEGEDSGAFVEEQPTSIDLDYSDVEARMVLKEPGD